MHACMHMYGCGTCHGEAFAVQPHCSQAILIQAFVATLIDSIHRRKWVGVVVCTQQPKTLLSFHMYCVSVCLSVCVLKVCLSAQMV